VFKKPHYFLSKKWLTGAAHVLLCGMKQVAARRKRRSDRNHVLYMIHSPCGGTYVGLTVMDSTPVRSMQRRWLKHVSRAANEAHPWGLCEAIRQYDADGFELELLEKVRGKAAAHAREVELISKIAPTLNTAATGRGTHS
jgi:hypothetical protein